MKSHLTEREIIEYEFKLASDVQARRIGAHLGDCEQCRQHLDRLKRRFAALELLREDVTVSPDLIARTVDHAQERVQTRVVLITKHAWLATVAATLVLGVLLLFISNLDRDKVPARRFPERSAPLESTHKLTQKPEPDALLDRDKTRIIAADVRPAIENELRPFAEYAAPGVPSSRDEQISEQPPFAPASAIELVTLPRRQDVQLTIYNSADLTLVRERRNLTLKKGWNWLQLMWANTLIDPTSLILEPLDQAQKVDIQQLVFPPRLRQLGRWLIRSHVSGQVPFEITYFTSGLNWRAFYMGTLSLDEKAMRLEGYVRVSNSTGEDYENAQTRLIVGQIHLLDEIAQLAGRTYPYDSPQRPRELYEKFSFQDGAAAHARGGRADRLIVAGRERKEITKEGLSEYFLYTIEGTETIPDKWAKRLLSFQAQDIPVKSLYKYDEQRWGPQPVRFVSFANDRRHNLGTTPIPDGQVKIYRNADSNGYLSYVGGTAIKYIPVNEQIELNLGPARLVKVEPVLMGFKTDSYVFDNDGNIAGWDEIRTWKIEAVNTRNLPVEIEITRSFDTSYWTLQLADTKVTYRRHDATHARFELTLVPRSKRAFEYTVRTYHGVREEVLAESKAKDNK